MRFRGMAAALLVAVILLTLQLAPVAAKAPASGRSLATSSNASRAKSAYNGMQKYFYISTVSLYHGIYPWSSNSIPYSYHWPFSQTMAATLDMNVLEVRYRSDLTSRLIGLADYWDAAADLPGYDSYVVPPYGNGGDKYHDDNAWSGLNLERAYRLTGDMNSLDQAEKVFSFNWNGWATSPVCTGAAGTGGIFWKLQTASETNHDRNTVSNGPNIELALLLYQDTKQQSYLDDALQIYNWVNSYLRDPADGLYWDHVGIGINGACTVEMTKWSYNQGSMIGANVLLYQVTGQEEYLDQAKSIASAALERYDCANGCTSTSKIFNHGPAFNAIFFRNLLFLSSVDSANPSYRQAAQSYADLIWNDSSIRKDIRGGTLFYFGSSTVDLLKQAAMVELYAYLGWNPSSLGQIL